MTQHGVHVLDGHYQVYATDDGIHVRDKGPKWLTPAEAARYADTLDSMPPVSPLRGEDDANTGDLYGPLSGEPVGDVLPPQPRG